MQREDLAVEVAGRAGDVELAAGEQRAQRLGQVLRVVAERRVVADRRVERDVQRDQARPARASTRASERPRSRRDSTSDLSRASRAPVVGEEDLVELRRLARQRLDRAGAPAP